MRGWILHKNERKVYENERLIEEARKADLELAIVRPNEVDLLVTRAGRKSVRINGEETALPDFTLPRTGSGTTYFALAVLRHLERLGVHTGNPAESIECVKDKLFSQQVLAASDLPVWIKPNAGLPQQDGDRVVYRQSPQEFAEHARKLIDLRINFLGGCCGTTPDHIRELARLVHGA